MSRETDVTIERHGNIFLFNLFSKNAEEWVCHNTSEDRTMWGNALVVDQHYAKEIAQGMRLDGLEIAQ